MLPLPAAGAGATGDTAMSSTQHQLIEQCATRLRGIVEALDNIHDTSPHRWSTDLDDVHSSAESLLAMIKDQAPPSEDQLIAAGLSYPLAKEDAVKLWYAGFRSEVVTVLEAWEAIGHDTGINPDKEELLESLRNMAAICNAHGNDMPAQSAIDQRQVIADAITGALAFGAQASQPPAEDHWLRPFYDIGRAEGQRTQDLAMLVRMLASSLKRHAPDSNLVARATNYLAAKGLAGTPLRDAPASVEQAGGDERAAFEAWEAWQARAALAQPSPVRSSLLINGYQLRAALDFIAPDGTAEQLKSEACIEWRQQDADFLEAGLYAFCAEYPEEGGVLLDEEPTTAQPSPLQSDQAEAERPALWAVHAQGPDELYAAFSREDAEKHAAELNALPMPEGIAVGAVVVPSPWPAVQHWQYLAEQEQDHKNEITGRLRQLERICEGLPQDAIDGGWTVQGIRGYAKRLEDQLKAALARMAFVQRLMDCDILALLPGWERSRGANIERNLAITLGMHVVDAEALPAPDFVCKCRAIQFTCCSVPSDNDPFVCRRLADMPAYLSPEDQLANARQALEKIAALTDVSTGGIGMDVLKIAKQALSN